LIDGNFLWLTSVIKMFVLRVIVVDMVVIIIVVLCGVVVWVIYLFRFCLNCVWLVMFVCVLVMRFGSVCMWY